MEKESAKYRNNLERRRVELLKEYYDFNEQTKTFDVTLHFEKASDMFNERFDLMKKRVMKEEIIEEVAGLLGDIPKGYKADLSLVVDDYEGVPYEEILDAFHNAVKLRLARFKAASRRKYHKVAALIVIGVFLIALMILGEIMGWWGGESIEGRLFSYVLDTAGCVFIWESLYSALLERTSDASLGYIFSTRLSSVGLYHNDDSDEALLSERNGEVMIVEKERLGKKAGSTFLYLSGFFLVGAGVIGILLRAPSLASLFAQSGAIALVGGIMGFLSSLFLCGLGFLAIMMFNENFRYYVLTAVASVLILAIVVLSFASMFLSQNPPATIIASTASLVAMVLYVLGFVLTTVYHRQDIKRAIAGKE